MKKNFQFSIFNFQNQGFTLVETLVAVSILALAIAGPMYVAGRSIAYAQIARDELIASALAQEGIEYVRKMRDDSYLAFYAAGGTSVSADAWAHFVSGNDINLSITRCVAPAKCTLDPWDSTPLRAYGESDTVPVLYLSSDGYYTQQTYIGSYSQTSNVFSYSGAALPPTAFKRTLQASAISPTDELIISTVSWTFHGIPYSISVRDHLTPWQ